MHIYKHFALTLNDIAETFVKLLPAMKRVGIYCTCRALEGCSQAKSSQISVKYLINFMPDRFAQAATVVSA